MRVVQINSVPYGSTGRIMFQLADKLKQNNHYVICTSGFTWKKSKRSDYFMTGNIMDKWLHMMLARITGRIGCFSKIATKRTLKKINKFKPDIIHLHNLHGWYINLPMLFNYIKQNDIRIIWTMHDCWAFTGHCPHYAMVGCEKWKFECEQCPQYNLYPSTLFDYSRCMHGKKKDWFLNVNNMTIVTPSNWLRDQIKSSFLKEYDVQVINNGIDLDVFKPTKSDWKQQNDMEGKYIVLGVAYAWDNKKGLDVFIELSKRLSRQYQIVLVGTDDNVDMNLPPNILSIHRTDSLDEMVNIYNAADVFVNPTREDTYPTVNMEAISCGTPVITFKTGGSPEMIDETCGVIVDCNDNDMLEKEIKRICTSKPFFGKQFVEKSKHFNKTEKIEEYLELYERVIVARN